MAFGGFDQGRQQQPMADINVTPMVDVMLVLLVIFIISAPLFTHAIKLDLPKAQAAATPQTAETVTISINSAGTLFWNEEAIGLPELDPRLAQAAQREPQPELQLRADKSTRYETIAQIMAAAQHHGIARIGFVTDSETLPKR